MGLIESIAVPQAMYLVCKEVNFRAGSDPALGFCTLAKLIARSTPTVEI